MMRIPIKRFKPLRDCVREKYKCLSGAQKKALKKAVSFNGMMLTALLRESSVATEQNFNRLKEVYNIINIEHGT